MQKSQSAYRQGMRPAVSSGRRSRATHREIAPIFADHRRPDTKPWGSGRALVPMQISGSEQPAGILAC